MDEARRFLRYLTPGLAFMIELAVYFLVSDSGPVNRFLETLVKLKDLGTAIALIITSGGVGYLLSLFHHVLYWKLYGYSHWPLKGLYVDHIPMLKHAIRTSRLELRLQGASENVPPNADLDRAGAWRIATCIWHERRNISKRIKAADFRSQSLTDLMHGCGTSLAGAVLALILWVALFLSAGGPLKSTLFVRTLLIALVMTCLHYAAYKQTVRHTEGFANIVISDELRQYRLERKEPLVVLVNPQDLKTEAVKAA